MQNQDVKSPYNHENTGCSWN